MKQNKLNKWTVVNYVFAGNATFTVKNTDTGNRFTYKITKLSSEDSFYNQPLWFVAVLTGSDNETTYSFIGTNFNEHSYKHSKKTKLNEECMSVKVWKWLCNNWFKLDEYPNLEIWHSGRCGRCGRTLTVPESIENGFGPECIHLIKQEVKK